MTTFLIYHIHLIQTCFIIYCVIIILNLYIFLNVISTIRHLKNPAHLEDMFKVYMKTRDMNVEFVTNYLRDNTSNTTAKSRISRFECTQNTTDTETKRPLHEVNYCIAMNICDKCPDDGSCDDCLPSYGQNYYCIEVHILSGLGGQNALEKFCKWAFDHPVTEGGSIHCTQQ